MIWKITQSGAGQVPREADWGGAKLVGQQHDLMLFFLEACYEQC